MSAKMISSMPYESPSFDGLNRDIEQFFTELEELFELHEIIEDRHRIILTKKSFIGLAKEHYALNVNKYKKFIDIKTGFIERFKESKSDAHKKLKEFVQIKQNAKEDVKSFYDRLKMHTLSLKKDNIDITESVEMIVFIGGLNEKIKNGVKRGEPTTMEGARGLSIKEERYICSDSEEFIRKLDCLKEELEIYKKKVEILQNKKIKEIEKKQILNIDYNMQNSRFIYEKNILTHNDNRNIRILPTKICDITKSNTSLYIFPISLNNKSFFAMYDTGAAVSLVDIKVITKLGLMQKLNKNCKMSLRSFTNDRISIVGSIWLNLSIVLEGIEKTISSKFIVTTQRMDGYDVIIGLPEIKSLKLVLNSNMDLGLINCINRDKDFENILDSLKHRDSSARNLLSKYSHIFCGNVSGLKKGSTISAPRQNFQFEKPYYQRQYPIPQADQDKLRSLVHQLLEADIIEPSNSPFNSPLFPIHKTNGELRITLDLKGINKNTQYMDFPMRRVEESLAALRHASIFSVLDLNSGFFQIKLPQSDMKFYSFTLPWGKYRFKRLVQGGKNSPQIFQKAMNEVFSGYLSVFVECFQDDLVVYSTNIKEHIRHLEMVFKRLDQYGLKAKPNKCSFLVEEFTFLGHQVSPIGIKPAFKGLNAIEMAAPPNNIKGVRSFLGMINFFRKFIPNCSKLISPITNLLKRNNKFNWTNDCQKAFEKAKEVICAKPVLIHPDESKPYFLFTDASDKAIGGVLAQKFNSNFKPIGYFSKALSDTEQKYSTIERETYAILLSLRHFKYYIYGHRTIVKSDHKPLIYNKSPKHARNRNLRWNEEIMDFSPEIEYIKGQANYVADYLSRINTVDCVQTIDEDTENYINLLIKEQRWKAIIEKIQNSKDKYLIEDQFKYFINENLKLVRQTISDPTEQQIIVPKDLCKEVMKLCHAKDFSSHLGFWKTKDKISRQNHWPHMYTDIKKITLKAAKYASSQKVISAKLLCIPIEYQNTHVIALP